MAEQAYWYVVHTYSGYENKVATDLMTMVENRRIQDLICDVKVPTETVMEDQFDKTGNKIGEKEVQRKIYPGYVFVKMVMNDNTWYIVRNTRGCTGFVGPASKPEPLSEEEVAKLGVDNGVAAPEVDYAVGDNVEIVRRLDRYNLPEVHCLHIHNYRSYISIQRSSYPEVSLSSLVLRDSDSRRK